MKVGVDGYSYEQHAGSAKSCYTQPVLALAKGNMARPGRVIETSVRC
jgi:hypothetical protein